MKRRAAAVAVAVILWMLWSGPAASAHGLGGRIDPRVPRWLFLYGAAAVLVISFVALSVLWKRPRFEGGRTRRPLPRSLQRILTSPLAEWLVRGTSLLVFVVVLLSGAAGTTSSNSLLPAFVFIWFWVGLAFLHAVLGNVWATLSPWDTLSRLFDVGSRPRRPYPKRWGLWPATILMLGFVWMELADPARASPHHLLLAAVVYTAITLSGIAVFGREDWERHGEAFAVYFGLLARIAPLARDGEGQVVLRPPLSGLVGVEPRPALVPFIAVLIGSTTFDGFTRSSAWLSWSVGWGRTATMVWSTFGLLAAIVAVGTLYYAAMAAAAALTRQPPRVMAVKFAHTLVPIAFAYAVAHYFSLLLLEGQQVLSIASDPFHRGWDLFGTSGWHVNFTLISAFLVWYVQVVAIVLGHVGGVVLAHDRAVALYPDRATQTQYAMLAVMVVFTVGGLLILSGG